MKTGCAKAFNAIGLILLTLQILVHLFEYIVNVYDVVGFFVATWAGVLGYVLLVVLFVRNIMSSDFILTLIGCLLWVAQFVSVFKEYSSELATALFYCLAGILGVLFIFVGLFVQTFSEKMNKS